jgi:hypothetical protein
MNAGPASWTSSAALVLGALLGLGVVAASPTAVRAQTDPTTPADEEVPGQTRSRYAWGEGGGGGGGATQPSVHRFARVFGSLGAGVSMRLYYDDRSPGEGGLGQEFLAPAYLQLRGGYFLEGDGDLQHGFGLGLSTTLMDDPPNYDVGFYAFSQWTVTPTYYLRIWLSDEVQLLTQVGVPIALSGTYQAFGVELGAGLLYKFLAGFGIYAQVTFSGYFAQFFQPLLSIDAGLAIDYEVLP